MLKSIKNRVRMFVPAGAQAYLVGGLVRDFVMGEDLSGDVDVDVCVVGSDHDQMVSAGFAPVGKSFRVYIHPMLGHSVQFALARTENSTGAGHTDFECKYEGVTLEQDLQRRDFTMNAMAVDVMSDSDVVIDPFGGKEHLKRHTLVPVGKHFIEDPLRMLRGFRFAAKYKLTPDADFYRYIGEMRKQNAYESLSFERINEEISKVVKSCATTDTLQWLIEIMYHIGKTSHPLLSLLQQMESLEQNPVYHPEGNVLVHTLATVGFTLKMLKRPNVSFRCGSKDLTPDIETAFYAALCHDLGKVLVAKDNEPMKYHGHYTEATAFKIYEILKQSRLSKKISQTCMRVARYHHHMHDYKKLTKKTIADMRITQEQAVVLYLVSKADCYAAEQQADNHYIQFLFVLLSLPALRGNAVHSVGSKDSVSNWDHKVRQQFLSNIGAERRRLAEIAEQASKHKKVE